MKWNFIAHDMFWNNFYGALHTCIGGVCNSVADIMP